MLGYRKVGFIFSQSVKGQKAAAEGDYIINSQELIAMAAMQVGLGGCVGVWVCGWGWWGWVGVWGVWMCGVRVCRVVG